MVRFAVYYIGWHYSQGLKDLVNIIANFLWFFYEFFSIPLLLKTLFSNFHRLGESYSKRFDPSVWFQAFIINTLMRLVGFFMRIFIILIGIFCILATAIFGVFFFFAWLLAPLLVFFTFTFGLKLISVG